MRQWRRLQLLDGPEGMADAARERGCIVRAIWRDREVFQAAGFPIRDDPQANGRRSIWRTREEF